MPLYANLAQARQGVFHLVGPREATHACHESFLCTAEIDLLVIVSPDARCIFVLRSTPQRRSGEHRATCRRLGCVGCMSRKLALWSVRELSFTNYFLGSSMGETKAHGLKRHQIKGFKSRGGGPPA